MTSDAALTEAAGVEPMAPMDGDDQDVLDPLTRIEMEMDRRVTEAEELRAGLSRVGQFVAQMEALLLSAD